MIDISIIVPLYNRPQEIDELLQSLVNQTNKNFEVIVVEDGSTNKSEDIVNRYAKQLNVKYFYKDNSGPGQTRNYGAERASGNYLIFFDSDCIIPQNYIETVLQSLEKEYVDAFGGPDATLPNFTVTQKAIGYAMTSFLTTGGIRGGSEKAGKFHPRSFNMGIAKDAFAKTGGYSTMRFGEDIDLTLRILEAGLSTKLIKEAFVYHKRRTDLRKFYRQVFNSGCARINLNMRHKGSLKLVHTLPAAFFLGNVFLIACLVTSIAFKSLMFSLLCIAPQLLFSLLIFIDSTLRNGIVVGIKSIPAAWVQLCGYGMGFVKAFWCRLILKQQYDTTGFVKNFYK